MASTKFNRSGFFSGDLDLGSTKMPGPAILWDWEFQSPQLSLGIDAAYALIDNTR